MLFILLGMSTCLMVQAAVFNVTATQDNVPGSLRSAITVANTNGEKDIIYLHAGIYILNGGPDENANAGGDLDVDTRDEISIIGDGAETTIIDGDRQDRAFHILNGKVTLSGITIRNCRSIPPSEFRVPNRDGGGIYNCATLTLKDCIVKDNRIGTSGKNNHRGDGGGIYNTGTLTITGCTIENNIAGFNTNVYYHTGPGGFGGGIYNSGSLTMNSSRICNNEGGGTSSSRDGGDPGDGGGIYNSETGEVTLTGCTVSGNFTNDGKGLARYGGSGGNGGGICSAGKLTLTRCTISANRTGNGGNGGCDGMGGPGWGGAGAGIFQGGEQRATLINCTLSNNSSGNGGDSCFEYFSGGSGGYGAGIFNGSTMTLTGCTICGNSTGEAGINGSKYEYEPATGGWGGGIYNAGTLYLQNTLVADNRVSPAGEGPDCSGTLHSQGHNLLEKNQGFILTGDLTGNRTGVDPLLLSLADNGGPTRTHALPPNSPAIDAGTSAGVSNDQRGKTRPFDLPGIPNVDDGSDIGAYELATPYFISGRITDGASGVTGVALTFSQGAGTAFTDAHGFYSHPLEAGWSGSVTPAKEDYSFTPSSRSYGAITAAIPNQDFVARPFSVAVTITHPADGDIVSGAVNLEAAIASNPRQAGIQSITQVEFYVDGSKLGEAAAPPYRYSWNSGLSGNGTHQISVKAFNSASREGEDEITVTVSNAPRIVLSRSQLNFVAFTAGASTFREEFSVINGGSGVLNWTIGTDKNWLACTPLSGSNSTLVTVEANYSSEMPLGTHTGTLTISSPDADNSPQTVTVYLKVINGSNSKPPFGSFDTPGANSTVMSSVPITGWVLDDIEVKGVQIYRESVAGEGKGLVFIGDGLFVEGARPDIQQKYPGYPGNYKAGWGYMLLSNFLPQGGNGYFTFHVIAEDWEGHAVTLGKKTVFCDNGNAVKPFGALDIPVQGGTVSGDDVVNFGWVLTPQPNTIPRDGSTIYVWVDGLPLGHPVYNRYRSDIDRLFPGYNNSYGAAGYFDLDTTVYEDGVHTIAWSVRDDAGNSDGIGSRYFTILNSSAATASRARSAKGNITLFSLQGLKFAHLEEISRMPTDSVTAIEVVKGYEQTTTPREIYPDAAGIVTIEIPELQRLEIRLLSAGTASILCGGYLEIANQMNPLPIGSTLDIKNNTFCWQPGPGFLREYRFVFIEKSIDNEFSKRRINVFVKPRFAGK